ncbi:hypothetical protein BMS3Abin15_00023 [bacterium BMS3Abin15]|nr:hypothetical protein BMS3Abin15_00023 [bacterium BMS3Abin15]
MSYDIELIAKVISPIIILLVSALIKHYTERRSKLVSFIGHISSFTLSGENQTLIFTHSIVVRNAGRKSANNVRVGHNFLPPNIQIYPSIKHSIEENPGSCAEIIFPILVPKEQVTISYLYFPPVTWDQVNAYTKSDDGFAKNIDVIPMPQPSKLVIAIVWLLMFIGASFVVYWLIKLLPFLLN